MGALSAERVLEAPERMLSVLVHSLSGDCCSATGGAGGQPPWSCWTRLEASIRGEEAFKELGHVDSESLEGAVCFGRAGGRDSSEKRTLFSEVRGHESSAGVAADARPAEAVASSDVLSERGLVDVIAVESRSLHSSATASVRASSSSKNSSKVVSGVWWMRHEHLVYPPVHQPF